MTAITLNALTKRINRRLAPEFTRLCKSRHESELGEFYLIDTVSSLRYVEATHVDPVELGRELGVLAANETLETA